MKLQYVRAFIVLLAGLIALIINMCMGRPITLSLFIVLVVILIFYVIGTLVVEILEKGMDKFKRSESADVSDEPEEMNQQPEEQTVGNVHFDEDEEDDNIMIYKLLGCLQWMRPKEINFGKNISKTSRNS